MRIRCEKEEIRNWLNGSFINKAIHCRIINNKAVTSGCITLQTELKDLLFRSIELKNVSIFTFLLTQKL